MNRKFCTQAVVFSLLFLAVANFYIFARFTVDDAFISWRYGRNLVDAGIWGYNPSHFDLTQAYTNPLMAVLSIIPAALHVDVVLFFKWFSLASLGLPLLWLLRRTPDTWRFMALYLLLLALPATMIHAFSGLETFLFAVAMGLLLIALLRQEFGAANLLALALLFIRPEAWLLVGLLPAYRLHVALQEKEYRLAAVSWRDFRKATGSFLLLGGCFALYAWFHWKYFGYVLPNTFYIKSGGHFDPSRVVKYLLFLSPTLVLLRSGHKALLLFIAAFFLPVIYNDACSDLQMDYAERFAYHVFAPIYVLLAYLAAQPGRGRQLPGGAAMAALLVFAVCSSAPANLVSTANYYPRTLDAHAALGKTIAAIADKYKIQRFALSDAGMAAYHARIVAFDNTGLGSALVAHQGPTMAVMAQYHPDIVVLRANDDGVVLNSDNKRNLFAWMQQAGYRTQCDVHWKPSYKLRIFSARPIPEFLPLCAHSKAVNDLNDGPYFLTRNTVPPWRFWHE